MKRKKSLSHAIFYPVAIITVSILLTASLLYSSLISDTISTIFKDRYLATQTLFAENVRNDLLTGSYAEVYRKCQAFFASSVVESIEINTSDKTSICRFSRVGKNLTLSMETPIYFDDNKKESAGLVTVKYSQELLVDLRRHTISVVVAFIAVLIVLLTFLIRRISNSISLPITRLSRLLKSGNIETLLHAENFTDTSKISEVETLYSETAGLAKKIQKFQSELIEKKTAEAHTKLATQLAHDIRSPLAALDMALDHSSNLQEEVKIIANSAIQRIRDIAYNLLQASKNDIQDNFAITTCLLSPLIESIISEKQLEYFNRTNITFELRISSELQRTFVNVHESTLKRIISNLINNAVDATDNQNSIRVILSHLNEGLVNILISDSGKGIPEEILVHLGKEGMTFGKEGGHGLGLFSAIQTVMSWRGQLNIKSKEGVGTDISILLPRAPTPNWLLEHLNLNHNDTIVILDDDLLVHQAWKKRFTDVKLTNKLINFEKVDDFMEWQSRHANLNIKFLLDYNVSSSGPTGIDLIEKFQLQDRSVLVTNACEDQSLIRRCELGNIKLLPKFMLPQLPISYGPQI